MLNSTYFVGLSLFNHCAINHSVVFGVSSQRTSVPLRGQGRPYSACKKNVMEVELEVFQFSCSMKSIMSVLWFCRPWACQISMVVLKGPVSGLSFIQSHPSSTSWILTTKFAAFNVSLK